jgi:hypothetical protein
MPREPIDDLLDDYLHERESDVDRACVDLQRRVDSTPPPRELSASRQRVIERIGTDTGSYDLRALEAEVRGLVTRAAAEKITEETRRREAAERAREIAEKRLEDSQVEGRRFWRGIAGAVLAGSILGVLTWTVITLLSVHGAH